jgi:CheY-like chemotaxis protein
VKPISILAAEDNEADVILFEEALAHHQLEHQLDVVRDGQAALDYLTRMGKPAQPPCPDLLLLDLNLPKVDGGTILSEFRKHPECRETPVIIVTSSDAERDRVRVSISSNQILPQALRLRGFHGAWSHYPRSGGPDGCG